MDTPLFSVISLFVAFNRQYKPGEHLTEGDLASWDVSEAEQEAKIAELLTRGTINKAAQKEAPEAPPLLPFEQPSV